MLIQNFKFGGMEKLGLGYDRLRAINPRLIYCSISGYNRSGPEAARPGYDLVIQGEAGLMAINGEADQPPLKFGVAVVDLMTGMYAAQAVLAALYQRQSTGVGRHVEMALFDCGLMITAYYGLEALLMGRDPPRYGNNHPSIIPYGVYDAADGPLVIAVGTNAQFQRFCNDVIERPDLCADERFKTNLARAANRAALLPELRHELGRRPRAKLLVTLTGSRHTVRRGPGPARGADLAAGTGGRTGHGATASGGRAPRTCSRRRTGSTASGCRSGGRPRNSAPIPMPCCRSCSRDRFPGASE